MPIKLFQSRREGYSVSVTPRFDPSRPSGQVRLIKRVKKN